jgi:hypothetical protein
MVAFLGTPALDQQPPKRLFCYATGLPLSGEWREGTSPSALAELVSEFSNGGREYHPTGEPTKVKTRDFIDKELGRAVPYGVYDLANEEGWVSVGDTAAAASFALDLSPSTSQATRPTSVATTWL